MQSPGSGVFTYGYDAVGNTTLLVNPLAEATAITYTPVNRPWVKTLANGAQTDFTYDPAERLVVLQTSPPWALPTSSPTPTTTSATASPPSSSTGGLTTWTYDPTRTSSPGNCAPQALRPSPGLP